MPEEWQDVSFKIVEGGMTAIVVFSVILPVFHMAARV